MIGKKIVCMRKNAEINCLPRGACYVLYTSIRAVRASVLGPFSQSVSP